MDANVLISVHRLVMRRPHLATGDTDLWVHKPMPDKSWRHTRESSRPYLYRLEDMGLVEWNKELGLYVAKEVNDERSK